MIGARDMSDHEPWQLDGEAPELYERYLVPTITSIWAADLVERARPAAEERVLDIACGTGAVTRLVADRISTGRVVGLDNNPGMLSVARSVCPHGPSLEWVEGSALSLPFHEGSFDLVLCQLGLQFFADKRLALREMRRVLAPKGRVALSVFGPIEHTPAAFAFVRALDHSLGPNASKTKRAEHMFAEAQELGSLLTDAGFDRVDVTTVAKRITFPSVLDYVRFQLIATPMADLLADRRDPEREAIICDIASHARSLLDADLLHGGRLCFPQVAFIATALEAG